MMFLSDFADLAVILPLLGAVALSFLVLGWRPAAVAWLVAVTGTLAAMLLLKVLILAHGGFFDGRLSNPSGHTAAGAVVYGGLIALCCRPLLPSPGPAILAGAAVAALFGATRVLLGVHTVPDVVVGAVVGMGGVLALVRLAGQRPVRVRLLPLALIICLVVLGFHGDRLNAEITIEAIAAQMNLTRL